MNYNNIYTKLIERARDRKKLRKGANGYVYYEKHHIVPKCLGGTDDKANLVYLTAEEHWVAHLLLVKMNPGNHSLVYACQAMSMTGKNNPGRTTNRLFGWIRRAYSESSSERQKGRIVPVERREKISKALKGRPALHQQGENNVSKRQEVAKKISDAAKGRKYKPRTEEQRKRASLALKGHKGSIGDANPSSRRVCCLVCKKETALPNLSRDHKKCLDNT